MSLKGLLLLIVLGGVGALALVTLPAPSDLAPDSGFDTESAMRHLRFIASEPRPLGSDHHRAVREYLVEQLRSLGLEVQVQDTRVSSPQFLRGLPIQVMNVIAQLEGTGDSSKAVMLAAHYDSTPGAAAPGAGDDGAAVAALLEVARLLAADPPKSDVIFLFTDGEESGMLGAQAFVDEHPWLEDVGIVFNFEARGTSGPSIMFETSGPQRFLVDQYARVAPHPLGSSLSPAIYRLMPNNTDFTIFRQAGLPGLNFAFIGDYANYHTSGDTVENLDPRSLRHHGVQAWALARHFGQMDLGNLPESEQSIHFNVPWLGIVHYPARWAVAIATIAAGLCMLALIVATHQGQVTMGGVIWGWVVLVLNIAAVAGIAWFVLQKIPPARLAAQEDWSISGFALLALACTSAILWLFDRRIDSQSFFAAGVIVWAILTLLTAGYVPGASYSVGWPAIAGAVALVAGSRSDPDKSISWTRVIVLMLAALPLVLLLTPVVYLAFLGLRIRAAAVMVSVIVLVLWQLLPQMRIINPRWLLPLLSGAGAAACFGFIVSD